MTLLLSLFKKFIPPEQKEMQAIVDKKGGIEKCQEDDEILKELMKVKLQSESSPGEASSHKSKPFELKDLKQDLTDNINELLNKNMAIFSRKFEMQKRQITEEMDRIVRREGDRIIGAITAGPHNRIVDRVGFDVASV